MLIKRGQLLDKNEEKAQLLTGEIEELINNRSDALQKPMTGYITFLNLESQIEALKQFNKK